MSSIRDTVKQFILDEFLPGEDPDELLDSTELMSGGILDSVATLKLVAFLEEEFQVLIEPHEFDEENLGSIEDIERFIQSKKVSAA